MVRAVFSAEGALSGPADNSLVGLTDLMLAQQGGEATLFAATRGDGWLTSYDVGNAAGQAQAEAQWRIDRDLLQLESTDLVLHQLNGQSTLYLAGLNSAALTGVQVELSGSGSPFQATSSVSASGHDSGEFSDMALFSGSNQGIASLRGGGLVNVSFSASNQLTLTNINQGNLLRDARAGNVVTASHNGQNFAFASYEHADAIGMFRQVNGSLNHVADVQTTNGFWADHPASMTVTEAADGTLFVIAAASGSSSLSVLEVSSSGGGLTPVDHLIDSHDTRFSNASHLTSVTIDSHNFVIAGGNDQGISLLTVLPGGRLQPIGSMPATAETPLRGITAIEAMAVPDGIRIWVATQAAPYLAEFSVSLPSLGVSRIASSGGGFLNGTTADDVLAGGLGADQINGGAGDDIVMDGGGADQLTGGSGADTFILLRDGVTDMITDFDLAADRIDISDFDQLAGIGTLSILSRNGGAEIRIGNEILDVRSADGRRLNALDFTSHNLIQGSRMDTDPASYPTGGSDPDPEPDPDPNLDPEPGPDPDPQPEPTSTPAGPAPDAPVWQAAPTVTLSWRSGDMRGSSSNELFDTFGQADRIFGNGGNDTINAGAGNDSASGDAGNDLVNGADGNDLLSGGSGNDTLQGGQGQDILMGGRGDDSIVGGDDADTIIGGRGNDRIDGQNGNDEVWADEGTDRVHGGSGDDWLSAGDNTGFSVDGMWGEGGNDTLFGNDHSDLLNGGQGDDMLIGGNGDDYLFGESGNDLLFGDAGIDRIFAGSGNDRAVGGAGDDGLSGGTGNDTLWGEAGDDILLGNDGDDILDGGQGQDSLYGGSGRDTLYGGAQNDLLVGGADADEFVFSDGHGDDVIADFDVDDPNEVIDLSRLNDLNTFNDVITFSGQVGGDVFIRTGVNSSIILSDVNRNDLGADDFIF